MQIFKNHNKIWEKVSNIIKKFNRESVHHKKYVKPEKNQRKRRLST